jgi:serine phosphatase RsbU (regulator of sigma subunit)
MQLNILNLKGNIRAQVFWGLVLLLFVYKLFFFSSTTIISSAINEIIVALTTVSLILSLSDVVHNQRFNPMSLVMNVGILAAVLFFLINFSNFILTKFNNLGSESVSDLGLLDNVISFIYSLIIIGITSYIFLVFKELFFLKQKKNVSTIFNTMAVFFILACLSTVLSKQNELSYIKDTFFIISILLIIISSIRISWMAFIVKKEKVALLIISIVISVLFIINLSKGGENNSHVEALTNFSSSLYMFLKLIMIYGAIYFNVLFFTTLFHLPTAEAFDRKAQEVNFLQYFSKLITESFDFDELAETVTDMTIKVCNAHSSWIIWKENGEFQPLANKNIGFVDSNIITKYLLEYIKRKNPASAFFINIKRLEDKSQLSEDFSFVAAAPLKAHNEIKGYIVATKKSDLVFDDDDANAMDTFSDYASLAIENSKLLEESIEKERLEKELDVAREIQRKILPNSSPEINNLFISSTFIPAFEVGGDYYDFFKMKDDKFGFVIADVSGKGISAAFIMAEVKGIFESLTKVVERPKEILIKANEILERTLDRHNFVSAAYGIIDLNTGVLNVARAGHCPIIFVRNKVVKNIRPSGIGLGLNFDMHFANSLKEEEIKLMPNDLIVLYTDGITEAQDINLEEFGSERLETILIDNYSKKVDEIAEKVIREVTLFSQHKAQHDDITLVILKWKENKNLMEI